MQTNAQPKPKCPRCGGNVYGRGWEIFATIPHKRRKYSCKECGHPFAEKIKEETPIVNTDGVVVTTNPQEPSV